MRKKIFAFLLLVALCASVLIPTAYADEIGSGQTESETEGTETGGDSATVDLPKVFSGATTGVSSRRQYTEATRPADDSPLNSVIDNPDYGNEFNFLTITNTTTGEAWRAGTMELVAGEQYLVEVYCRHDGTDSYRCTQYGNITLEIDMPYELGAGDIQGFAAKIVAGDRVNIYASISVVAQEGVSVQYVDATAKSIGPDGQFTLDYKELFGEGTNIVPWSRSLKVGDYRLVSFVIQVLPDSSVPAVNPNLGYADLLSAPGTGFEVPNTGSEEAGEPEPASANEGENVAADGEWTTKDYTIVVLGVIAGGVIGGIAGFMVGRKKKES